MKKLTLFATMLFCASFLSAQLIKNTTVSEVLASDDFEKDSVWINFDQASLKINLDNSFGGTQNFKWSSAWGGAAINKGASALGGNKCMQVHWGGYAILEGYTIDLTKIYQVEVLMHPAGGNDGTWNNWAALHLFTFDSSELWQTQGMRIRLMNGGTGGNPNRLDIDVWEGESGTYRNLTVLDFNSNPNDFYINGNTAAYWIPLKIIFTGDGSVLSPFLIDFYLNDKFIGSQSLKSLYWLGDQMIGFGRNGSDTDAAKFDNIKISKLTQSTGINETVKIQKFTFNSSDNSINAIGYENNSKLIYDIYNSVGRKIHSGYFNGSKAIIPVNLNCGVYIAQINDNSKLYNYRFIVK